MERDKYAFVPLRLLIPSPSAHKWNLPASTVSDIVHDRWLEICNSAHAENETFGGEMYTIGREGGLRVLLIKLAVLLASLREKDVEVRGVYSLFYSILSPALTFWWTKFFIYSTTKPCPNKRCRYRITKNGGCSHMKCIKCNTVFCWFCGTDYRRAGHAARCSAALVSNAATYAIFLALPVWLFSMCLCILPLAYATGLIERQETWNGFLLDAFRVSAVAIFFLLSFSYIPISKPKPSNAFTATVIFHHQNGCETIQHRLIQHRL